MSSRSATPALKERNADDLLAEFAHAGGEEAFGEVVRRYAAMTFGVCLKVTGNAHDAEDATQATFLSLALTLKSGKAVYRVGPWLQRVARRAALDVRRSRKRRRKHEQRHGEDRLHAVKSLFRDHGHTNGHAAALLGNGKSAARNNPDEVDLEKLNAVLSEELGRLPPKYRLPLMSLYFGQMEREEIAHEMGLSMGTLGVRIHRGRQMLARRLSERGVAPAARLLSGNALALAVATVARANFAQYTAAAAARHALGHDVAAATAAHVVSALKGAAAAAMLAKLKGLAAVALLVLLSGAVVAAAGAAVRWDAVAPHVPKSVRNVVDWARSPWHVPIPRPAAPTVPSPVAQSPAAQSPAAQSPAAPPWEPRVVALAEPARDAPRNSEPRAKGSDTTAERGPAIPGAAPARTTQAPAPVGGPAPASPAAEAPEAPAVLVPREGPRGHEALVAPVVPSPQPHGADLRPTGDATHASVPQLHIGSGDDGSGATQRVQRISNGALVVGAPPITLPPGTSPPPPPVDIGIGGTLHLGDELHGGTIVQPVAGFPRDWPPFADGATAPPSFAIRGGRGGAGTVRGWGGSVGNGGALINNGRVIADGHGQDRALIFTGYSAVLNTVDNPPGGRNGWFATGGGRLFLPKLPIVPGTHTYTWGESADDPQIDLVNSVRVTLRDAQAPGKLEISLLDKTRTDVPTLPAGHTFIGVWSFDAGVTGADGVDLTVRYDDGLARRLGLNENVLKLWRYDGEQWLRINDASFSRDTANNLISGHADDLSFFAVSAPEPSVLVCLGLGGALMLLRRPRRAHRAAPIAVELSLTDSIRRLGRATISQRPCRTDAPAITRAPSAACATRSSASDTSGGGRCGGRRRRGMRSSASPSPWGARRAS